MSEYEAFERGVNAGLGWAMAGGPAKAPEPENPYFETPTDVLVAHQRQGAHACLCGELPLGSSFAQHQIDMLVEAGFLNA